MKKYVFEILNGLQYCFSLLQANRLFQFIELCLSIAFTIVLIIFKIVAWYKKANADGNITAEELKEGASIIDEGKTQLMKDLEEVPHKPTSEELEDIFRKEDENDG